MSIFEVDTKKEAFNLVHDPTKLLSLLYSKYGDIEEDFNDLYTNQILYNKSSHFNIIFKEYLISDFIEEFLKRFYSFDESLVRIPKLSEYYKNYHKFFCQPFFIDFKFSSLMHTYGDNKAEIFYKNNYENKLSESKENKNKNSSSSLESIDNITNNKTIFDKKTRNVIDNNINKITMTLDSSRTALNKSEQLCSKRSVNSFKKIVDEFINYKKNRKKNFIINNKEIYSKNYNNNKKHIINKTINDLNKNNILNDKKINEKSSN